MAFNERLKEARIASGLTQKQLAEKLGIAGTTVTGYEKGNSEPNVNTIGKIMDILQVDANFLWQDEMNATGGFQLNLQYNEMEHIKKYRSLDDYGKDIIDTILEKEYARCEDEYVEIAARGGKYKVKREALFELAKRLDAEPYEEDHDLC
ncbi:helix-turn-helix domain-containing protein [Anaerotignum sp.]|uniref:helix-turn-helix domain-containing protein n=1 Tax=Anaerotignum sp. TaxID=2039241 RepID=UPI00373615A3